MESHLPGHNVAHVAKSSYTDHSDTVTSHSTDVNSNIETKPGGSDINHEGVTSVGTLADYCVSGEAGPPGNAGGGHAVMTIDDIHQNEKSNHHTEPNEASTICHTEPNDEMTIHQTKPNDEPTKHHTEPELSRYHKELEDEFINETPMEWTNPDSECSSDDVDGLASLLRIGGFMKKDYSFKYNMDHKNRGTFIIINNKKFNRDLDLPLRDGTDVDAANLYHTFNHLGFNSQHYKNLTCRQMRKLLKQVSRNDHWDSDCFGCAILSHGEEGVVYGTDGEIDIEKLIVPFKGCRSLLGKPKLFFIQACRGHYLDPGDTLPAGGRPPEDTVDAETPPESQRIPIGADFLFAYSTVPGYLSWRNSTHGSWFIQALCGVVEDIGQSKDILQILTRTNHHVAYKYESKTGDKYDIMNAKKQIPSIVSMLTKKLVFKKK